MSSNSVPQAVFGPGSLYITRNDIPNGTPVNIGYAQEFSYDETGELKELHGQNQYPIVAARGTVKATGKIKAATVSGIALNAAMWGLNFAAGQLSLAQSPVTAIPISPFTITPTVPDSGTFDADLGVINAATGVPLTQVASAPGAGQYSQTGGVYTFSSADHTSGISVIITFAYTHTAAGGQTLTVTNQPIGSNPTFQLDYSSTLYGAGYYARFFVCVSTKLVRAHKLTEFMLPEIDFSFFANPAGKVYETSFATLA